LRGEINDNAPVRVTWAMGSGTPGDLIWTTSGAGLIISHDVLTALRSAGCSGWNTFPVQLFEKRGQQRDGFYGLSVCGRCGPINYERSSIVWREFPGGWFPHFKGEYFDPSSWDGSDVFMEQADSRGHVTASIYGTTRTKSCLELLENIAFRRLSDIEVDIAGIRIGSAHRLPADIDARLRASARESGRELS
jgi:hypothetical protein